LAKLEPSTLATDGRFKQPIYSVSVTDELPTMEDSNINVYDYGTSYVWFAIVTWMESFRPLFNNKN
jgi:hypothetical protein